MISTRCRGISPHIWTSDNNHSPTKMEPLLTNQRVMMWLCMCPANESTSKSKIMIYTGCTFIVVTVTSLCLLFSGSFVVNYLSIDFERSLYAVFQVSGEAAMLNLIFVGFFMRNRINAIFTQLSEIYVASKHHRWKSFNSDLFSV